MSLFAIGDPHLAISVKNKNMDIVGGWENYLELLEDNWKRLIKPDDTVVLAGDISWAMKLPDAYEDFAWIENLPGKKIILKGNHDYWWGSKRKWMTLFQPGDSIHSIFCITIAIAMAKWQYAELVVGYMTEQVSVTKRLYYVKQAD